MPINHKVTIGIPVYNAEKYVERSVLSALNQTFDDVEILILNDACTDYSMEKIATIIHPNKDSIRIITNKTNQGIGAARNAIIEHAEGQFLYFIDSDDKIAPETIETMYNLMQQQPVDFIVASSYNVAPSGEETTNFTYANDTLISGENQVVKAFLKHRSQGELIYTPVWNKLFDINFLRQNKIKCTEGYVYEDSFFTLQTILKAQSCRLIPNILYWYYAIDTSIAHQGEKYFTRHYIDSCLQMTKDLKQLFSQYTESPIFEELIISQLTSCFYLFMFIAKKKNRDKLIAKDLRIATKCYPLTLKRLIKFSFRNKLKGIFFLFISIYPSTIYIINRLR